MAVPKKPEISRKIIDVSHPDSSASDTSSKPVLITNRPIMKDPMVVNSSDKKEDTVEPLSAPILQIENVEDTNKEAEPEPEAKASDEKEEVPAEAKTEEVSLNPEPNELDDTPETDNNEAEPEVKESTDTKEEDNAKKAESNNNDVKDENESDSDKPDEKSAELIDAEEAEKQTKHDAEIDKLVESKQYYLPINSVEKRRSRRFVLLGVLLSAVLLLAWADIALDAGLVNLSSSIPHTHIFSSSSKSDVTTVTTPVTVKAPVTSSNSKTKEQLSAIQTLLEAYFTTNNYYPNDLTPSPLINQPGVTGVTNATLTAPTGTKFVYTAFPSGCNIKSKNCLHYTLKAMTASGKLIVSQHSIN